MKKALSAILLIAILFADFLMLGLMYSNIGPLFCLVLIAAVAVLLIRPVKKLRSAADEAERKKALRQILLFLLVPAVIGLVIGAYVVISLMLYFG